MGIHVGVNGTPKEVVGVYVGVNGTPKECSDVYVGVNGTPKSCYSGVKPGETIFTSSSTFTVPKGVKKIDVFCVGGGGGGAVSSFKFIYCDNSTTRFQEEAAPGGGGGYTATKLGVAVNPGDVISVTVGAGGNGGRYYWMDNFGTATSPRDGGASSVGSICSAAGGYGDNNSTTPCWGGSGGGITARSLNISFASSEASSGESIISFTPPGIDGGDAIKYSAIVSSYGSTIFSATKIKEDGKCYLFSFNAQIGKGQGTTTRYFGESTGTLYAGGGVGMGIGEVYTNGGNISNIISRLSIINSDGSGGGGNGRYHSISSSTTANTGASGICIIRWGKQ